VGVKIALTMFVEGFRTIRTTVQTSAIGIQAIAKRDVRAVVLRDHSTRCVFEITSLQSMCAVRNVFEIQLRPIRLDFCRLESAGVIETGAASGSGFVV
jgi:hypothetical protein